MYITKIYGEQNYKRVYKCIENCYFISTVPGSQ